MSDIDEWDGNYIAGTFRNAPSRRARMTEPEDVSVEEIVSELAAFYGHRSHKTPQEIIAQAFRSAERRGWERCREAAAEKCETQARSFTGGAAIVAPATCRALAVTIRWLPFPEDKQP